MNPAVAVDGWGESTSVDDGSLMPSSGMDAMQPRGLGQVVERVQESTIRANADKLADRPGTLDEPTVDRQSQPPRRSLERLPLRSPALGDPRDGKLVVISGNDNGREFQLHGTTMSVGRALDNDVVLTDIAVSRKHLSIEFDGQQYVLVDHGSGNGSVINDRMETGRCTLRHGDRIELGNTVFRFEHPMSSGASPTAPPADEFDDGQPTTVARSGSKKKIPSLPQPQAASPAPPPRRHKPITLPPPNPQAWQVPRANHHMPPPFSGASPESTPPEPLDRGKDASPAPFGSLPAAAPAELPGPAPTADPRAQMGPFGHVSPFGQTNPGPMGQASPMGEFSTDRVGHASVQPNAMLPGYDDLEYPSIRPSNRKLVVGLLLASVAIIGVAIVFMLTRNDAKRAGHAADDRAQRELADQPSSKLPATVWGTDETVLVASIGKTIVPADATGTSATEDKAAEEKAAAEEAAAEKAAAEEAAAEKAAAEQAAAEKAAAEQAAAEKAAAEQAAAEEAAAEKAAAEKAAAEAARKSSKTTVRKRSAPVKKFDSSAARSTATSQYKSKDFTEAAQTLRKAADDASAKQAKSLRSTASSYEKVGTLIDSGNSKQSRDPVAALSAYDQAYQLDKKVGDGAHSSFLRSKLSIVAPKAAASHMAKGRYEAAKSAADKAATYGAGSNAMVKRVRQGLERKAEEFYKDALRNKSKNKAAAKTSLQRILKMVPASSPSYKKAAKLLSKLG